ncbi:MAG TPA: hypothetical protein VN756_11925 [Solirubrobacterales bacterium]|nr:hypothetical protein [Solirubrobacterales bacterium]
MTNVEAEDPLRAAYRAFNARDVEAAPRAHAPPSRLAERLGGGRVFGREAVARPLTS